MPAPSKLFRDGEPVKMSKRFGRLRDAAAMVEEVGRDSVRFMMLYRKSSEPLDFDFAKVTEQSKIIRSFTYSTRMPAACRSSGRPEAFPDIDVLSRKPLRKRCRCRIADRGIAIGCEGCRVFLGWSNGGSVTSRIVSYSISTISPSSFHAHWNKGKDQVDLRFINDKSRV